MAIIVKGDLMGANGKVGNKIYYTSNGKTIVREISASNYNSKTVQQLLQRVIMKTVVRNYSAMKDIANHSFEGVKVGADSMARFNSLNAAYFRDRAAQIVNEGMSLAAFVQFSKLGSKKFTPAAVYLSEGTLTQIHPGITPFTTAGSAIATLDVPVNTYASLANQYNLKRGDQVTFCTVEKDAYGEYLFKYERLILDPRTEDGDAAPMSSPLIVDNAFGTPSRRNQGEFYYLAYDETAKQLRWKAINGDVCAVAVIASRKSGSTQFRSTSKFVLSEEVLGTDKCSLLEAIGAAQAGATEVYLDEDNALYLNNEGEGGSQGSASQSESDTPVDKTMRIDPAVKFNGVSQDVSGGNVSITASQGQNISVEITGQNIDAAKGEAIGDPHIQGQPDMQVQRTYAEDGTKLTFVLSNFTIPATIRFDYDTEHWFNLAVALPSSDDGTDES